MSEHPNGHDHDHDPAEYRVDPRDVICSILTEFATAAESQQLSTIGLSEMYFLGKREAFQIAQQVIRNPSAFIS